MVESDTLFQTKTAKKPYPLARHIPIKPTKGTTRPGRKTRCRLRVSLLTPARLTSLSELLLITLYAANFAVIQDFNYILRIVIPLEYCTS